MKKITLLLTIALLFFNININAQGKKGKEKIHALKIAFLTEKLSLSSSEAEKFWPVYNEYSKQRRVLYSFEKKEIKDKVKNGYDTNNITDNDAKNILKKINELREERFKNKRNFNNDLLTILSPKKILLLEISEHEFHKTLIKKYKSKKE